MIALLLALLLLAGPAHAVPIWMSGFEAVNATAGNARVWLEGATEVGTSTSSYPVIAGQTTNASDNGVVHNNTNGGSASSKWSKHYTADTTLTIYDQLTVSPRDYNLCVTMNPHFKTGRIGTNTDILAFVEETGSALGCGVRVTTGERITLWYRDPTGADAQTLGDAPQLRVEEHHCSDDPLASCTTGTDCASGSCATCTPSTGAGCYFPGVELCQTSAGPQATCTLFLNGAKQAQLVAVPAITPTKVQTIRFGIVAKAGSGTTSLHIDDMLWDDGTRAGFGYAEKLTPDASAGLKDWSKTSCDGTGPQHYPCIDDYNVSPFSLNNASYLTVSAANKTETISGFTDPPALPSGATYAGVRLVHTARANNTSGTGTRSYRVHLTRSGVVQHTTGAALASADTTTEAFATTSAHPFTFTGTGPFYFGGNTLPAGVDTSTQYWTIYVDSTHFKVATSLANAQTGSAVNLTTTGTPDGWRLGVLRIPNVTTDQNYTTAFEATRGDYMTVGTCLGDDLATLGKCTQAAVNNLGMTMISSANSSGGIRMTEAMAYAWVRRPDQADPATIRDANLGAADNVITWCGTGDSLNGATASSVCSNDETVYCTSGIAYYCSWDAVDRDEPNCLGDDTNCYRCAGRQTENGGRGIACTSNGQCPVSGDTCNTGSNTCTLNPTIPCTTGTEAVDCNGLGGSCDTAATCIEACPGGTCAGFGGWFANVQGLVGGDNIIVCSHGGESSQANVLLNATAAGPRFIDTLNGLDGYCTAVQGTGQCQCTGSGDCDSATCTSNKCVGGADGTCVDNSGCKTCASNSDCGNPNGRCVEGRCACQFAPCDALAILEGVNDLNGGRYSANCTNADAVNLNMQAGQLCDLTGGSYTSCVADSTCTALYGPDSWCGGYDANLGPSTPCASGKNVAGVAGASGAQVATCTAYAAANAFVQFEGGCATNADCEDGRTCSVNESGYKGRNGHCRCAADGNCPSGYVCKNSICRKSCTSDANCVTSGTPYTGVCDTAGGFNACKGRCIVPCSTNTCTTDADCPLQTGTFGNQLDPITVQPQCVSGRCRGCGFAMCELDTNNTIALETQRRIYPQVKAKHFGYQYRAIEDYIAAQTSDTDGRPIVLGIMHPDYANTNTNTCFIRWCPPYYLEAGDWWMQQNMQYVFDLGRVFDPLPKSSVYVQLVHFQDAANRLAGEALAERMNAINACVVGRCLLPGEKEGAACGADGDCSGGRTCYLAQADPQRYCKNPDGTWDASPATCTESSNCAAGEECSLRPCACTCVTNKECTNWYGTGYQCSGSPKKCTKISGGADACTVYGGGYSCNTTSKKCENAGADVCTASLDVCAVQ